MTSFRDTNSTLFGVCEWANISVGSASAEGALRAASSTRLCVSRLKRMVLSKSSTLTRATCRKVAHSLVAPTCGQAGKYDFWFRIRALVLASYGAAQDASLAFSGSNQAREGRLVDALAVRGDEGRDTLR